MTDEEKVKIDHSEYLMNRAISYIEDVLNKMIVETEYDRDTWMSLCQARMFIRDATVPLECIKRGEV